MAMLAVDERKFTVGIHAIEQKKNQMGQYILILDLAVWSESTYIFLIHSTDMGSLDLLNTQIFHDDRC